LGLYSLAVKTGASIVGIGIGFGAVFALAITGLWVWQVRQK
jgi:LPLT family lysophospholipid transporter-like MFS transporter